jgi:hypothetical protein
VVLASPQLISPSQNSHIISGTGPQQATMENNMEILIKIPPWMVSYWDCMVDQAHFVSQTVSDYSKSIWRVCFQNHRNTAVIALSMFFFWPFFAYCFIAVTTAWAWIFWLFASILMGILQMCYVTYQFCMIAVDIFILTLLKTYQVVMRSRAAQFVFFSSRRIHKARSKLSRRREWRMQCEAVKEYEAFLKIPVLENAATTTNGTNDPTSPVKSPLRRAIRKSRSVAAMETLKEETIEQEAVQSPSSGDSASSPPKLKRRWSLSKLKALQDAAQASKSEEYSMIEADLGPNTTELLLSTTDRLLEERTKLLKGEDSGLEFLLSGVVKRNHLALEDLLVSNARSVAVSGQYQYAAVTRKAISSYYHEVRKGLEALTQESNMHSSSDSITNPATTTISELQGRIKLLRKMKQNMGRTALMLSGGGAQAMYHLGTIRALIQSGMYDNIKVISGTSGGSIAAACCAMFTSREIFNDICVSTVSTDYRLNGEMKRRNIRWFPPVVSTSSARLYQHDIDSGVSKQNSYS